MYAIFFLVYTITERETGSASNTNLANLLLPLRRRSDPPPPRPQHIYIPFVKNKLHVTLRQVEEIIKAVLKQIL